MKLTYRGEPLFALKIGSSRMTLLVGPLAIKLPLTLHPRWDQLRGSPVPKAVLWWRAVVANVTGRATWDSLGRPSFLAPTYCSLGAVAVSRRIIGAPLEPREVGALIGTLPEAVQVSLAHMDRHFLVSQGNLVRTASGQIVLVDYGDTFQTLASLATFLRWHRDEFEAALAPPG